MIKIEIQYKPPSDFKGDPIDIMTSPNLGIKVQINGKSYGYPLVCSDREDYALEYTIPVYLQECILNAKKQHKKYIEEGGRDDSDRLTNLTW